MPGTVTFKPLEVNLTKDTSLFGKPDPYCIVSLGNQKIQTQISESESKFPLHKNYPSLHVKNEPTCLIELKDQENPNSENIGAFHVSLDEIESQGSLRRWFSIYNKQDQATGKVLLEAIFTPENETPTDLPASPEDNLVTPEDKLMSPGESDKGSEDPESGYKYPQERDDLLEDQLSPVEIEFPMTKKGKEEDSSKIKWIKYEDVDSVGSLEEFKTDLAFDLQQYRPRLSVVYKSHPLEMEDENMEEDKTLSKKTKDKLTKSAKGRDFKEKLGKSKSLHAKPEVKGDTPGGDEVDIVELYKRVTGSKWDL